MSSLNKAMLIGRLGKDPETRYMPSGDVVCNISIATSERWKDKTTGEQKEKTDWHNVVMFGRLAEIAAQYLTKGGQVYIEGKLQTRKWEKDGQNHYSTEIIADQMRMLGSKPEGQNSERPASRPTQQATRQAPAAQGEFEDDDIPF